MSSQLPEGALHPVEVATTPDRLRETMESLRATLVDNAALAPILERREPVLPDAHLSSCKIRGRNRFHFSLRVE